MHKPSWMLVIMMTAAVVAALGDVFAGDGPNTTLPFTDGFEAYTNGTPLIDGTNGWYGDSSNIIVQTHTVRSGINAAMIPEDCTLSNRFESIAPTNIWIQMDLQPSLYDGTNPPVVDTNSAVMFYINSNGNFVVHNGPATNTAGDPDPTNSANWVVATNNVQINTNGTTWVRINIYENFAQTNWDLYADGVLVTNNIGFVNPNLTNFLGFDVYNGATTGYLDNVSVSAMDTNAATQRPLIVIPPTPSVRSFFVGVTPSVQTAKVCNVWPNAIDFATATDQPWISAAPVNGTVTGGQTNDVTLTYASTAGWPVGTSNANVTVGGAWGTQTMAVVVNIMDLRVLPSNILTDTVAVGAPPANRDFYVTNAGPGSFFYTAAITNTCTWMSFSDQLQTSGTVNAFSANTLTLTYSNTAGLTAGTNNAIITIASSDGGGATQTVTVALYVTMQLQGAPLQLTNEVMQGEWTTNSFTVSTVNTGVANYTVTAGQPWLVVSPATGSLTGPAETATIGVTYTNTSVLTVGPHYGTITISAPGCADVPIGVTLHVQAPPMLYVSPASIITNTMEGQNLASNVLLVWNASTNYDMGYQVTTNQGCTNWLAVVVTNNSLAPLTTNNLTLNYTVGNLTAAVNGPSNYYGAITVTATTVSGALAKGSPVTIPVTVRVNPKPRLALSSTNLSQTVLQGCDAGSQWFEIWNSNGFYTLSYTIANNASWLVLTPTNGTSAGEHDPILVEYSTANLPAGNTQALITVVGRAWDGVDKGSALNATQTIVVALTVTPFATLSNDAHSVYSYWVRKGLTPSNTVFSVWNGGMPPQAQGIMYFTVSPLVSWLSAAPASGTLAAGMTTSVTVTCASTAGITQGVYSGTVRIDATDARTGQPAYGSPSTFTIEIIVYGLKGFDFQGGTSGASDLVVYREASGSWVITNLVSKYATNLVFGGAGYQAVPGDYFGDGVTDLGVYRPASGSWYAWQVGAGSVQAIEMQQWTGKKTYAGVPGDYDGDGLIDPGVYVEKSGLWSVLLSGDGYTNWAVVFGGPGYAPLQAGDYDGDGKVDFGVYHRKSGLWRLLYSGSDYAEVQEGFGGRGFTPVPTDYNGDGYTDPAVYENHTGWWYILLSSPGAPTWWDLVTCQIEGAGTAPTLVPAPGDYYGVGGADIALYDSTNGCWHISTTNGVYPLGGFGYRPVLP